MSALKTICLQDGQRAHRPSVRTVFSGSLTILLSSRLNQVMCRKPAGVPQLLYRGLGPVPDLGPGSPAAPVLQAPRRTCSSVRMGSLRIRDSGGDAVGALTQKKARSYVLSYE